ncbi:hypothetical protein [Winogradskyella sp. SM1960]|uniref:hypothetical protein n=1 Tax=Winogradskyella sp. SM1960 TaxID=2865955 RepID=UPI001CD61D96|nr:hypothetical protein [Winogradskyella sp. SM1960]
MRVEIKTYSRVVKHFNYLEKTLEKSRLSKEIAILYFQILLDQEEDGYVQRPHFTFQLKDFDKYLLFFQKHNFIGSSDENTFNFSKEHWKDKKVNFVVEQMFVKNEMLHLTETYEELNSCFHISA